jgi:hypothetical protein
VLGGGQVINKNQEERQVASHKSGHYIIINQDIGNDNMKCFYTGGV